MNASFRTLIKLTAGLLATASLTIGCGTDNAPLSPTDTQEAPASNVRSFLTFGPNPAGKVAVIPEQGISKTKTFKASGTEFKVEDKNESGPSDDITVTFQTLPGAVTADVSITMTVYGNTLSQMIVAFEPGGLNFLVPAILELDLGNDLIDLDLTALQVTHEHGDGSTEAAVILSVEESGPSTKILIEVPGFSRYSPGGGW